jgi:hypothetical protein
VSKVYDSRHKYTTFNGKIVPGVTTVLDVLNKPALVHWAWNLGMQGIDYHKFKDDLADVGKLAHAMVVAHLKGEKINTDAFSKDQIDRAENCLLSYFEWEKGHKIEPILIETPLVNDILEYGGQPDVYCKLDGKITLLDFKTGKAVYDEYFYQLAAYGDLLSVNKHEVPSTFHILRIGRDETEGFEEVVRTDLSNEFMLFLSCLNIYKLKKIIRDGR